MKERISQKSTVHDHFLLFLTECFRSRHWQFFSETVSGQIFENLGDGENFLESEEFEIENQEQDQGNDQQQQLKPGCLEKTQNLDIVSN